MHLWLALCPRPSRVTLAQVQLRPQTAETNEAMGVVFRLVESGVSFVLIIRRQA